MKKIDNLCVNLLTMLVLMVFGNNVYLYPAVIDNVQQIERIYSDDEVEMNPVDIGLFEQQISSSPQLIPEIIEGDVVIDSVIDVPPWDGISGGVYFLEASGTVTVTETGVINATGKGYRGGDGGDRYYPSQGQQGESILGIGGYYWEANGIGGGGGRKGHACCNSFGGGGGAHVTNGTGGEGGDVPNCVCPPWTILPGRYGRPGIAIGEVVDFGGGGGGGNGGGYWYTTGLRGGNGGGIIRIKACKIIVRGKLEANGADGQDGPWAAGDTGGGGGGGGGTIWLEAAEIYTEGGTLSVAGGQGSRNPDPYFRDRANGGDGGEGLIKLDEVFCVDVIPSSATIDGNNSDRFRLRIIPDTVEPSAYQWTGDEVAHDSLGNTEDIDFKTPSQRTTTIENAHWFATPDSRLESVTGLDCEYMINCDVTINGDVYSDTTPPTWRVYLPRPPGATDWPRIEGMPRIRARRVEGQKQWFVSDMGDLTKTAPVKTIYIPQTSQFYNKINIHEERHVTQWTSMDPWQNLFNATALYNNTLVNLTSTVSRQDMEQQIQNTIDRQNAIDSAIAGETAAVNDRERDAFNVSNAVPPDYLEVDIP